MNGFGFPSLTITVREQRVPAEDTDVLTAFSRRYPDRLLGDTLRAECVWPNAHDAVDGSVVLYSRGVPIAFRAFSGHGGVVFDERPGGRRLGRIMAHARRATAAVQEAGCPVEIVDHEAFVARCEQIGAS
jgi:hypothetical protein